MANKRVSHTINIQAPPQRVWEVLREIERWPEWTSTMTSLERVDGAPLKSGTRVRIRQPGLLPAEFIVTEWNESRHAFTWVSRRPGVQAAARHVVEARGSTASKVTLSVEFSGLLAPLIAWLMGSMTERYVATEAEGLKQRSEGTR